MFFPNHKANRQLTATTFRLGTSIYRHFIPCATGDCSPGYHSPSATQHSHAISAQSSSPINGIPVELLGEIFAECLRNVYPHKGYVDEPRITNSPSRYSDPVALAQVCRHWRAVALSMPTLWASMSIGSPRRGHLALTRLWLQRSGDCPLHIHLYQLSTSDIEHAITNDLITLLATQIHRWRSLKFRFEGKFQSALSQILPGSLKQLKSATVFIVGDPWEYTSVDNLWRIIHGSPTICQVDWKSDYIMTMPLHVPWMLLTVIHINGELSTSTIFDILHSCQNVVDLDILVSENSTTPSAPATLPYLRHLSIKSRTPLNPIFDQLILMQLSSLRLVRSHLPMSAEEFDSLEIFLRRSQCSLSKLTFGDMRLEGSGESLLAALGSPSMSLLNDLRILTPVDDRVIGALTRRHSQDRVLPVLEKLRIVDCRATPGVLGNMVSSRMVASDGLLKLGFFEVDIWDMNPVDAEILRELAHGGLHTKVDYDMESEYARYLS